MFSPGRYFEGLSNQYNKELRWIRDTLHFCKSQYVSGFKYLNMRPIECLLHQH